MKTVIIGSNGQLGSDLMRVFADCSPIGLTHEHIEIDNAESVLRALGGIEPQLVINTAAYHNVPKCETEIGRAFEVNATGALNLAKASVQLGFEIVHVSTDYVFDGSKQAPYVETDIPQPLNIYAISKLAGEHCMQAYASRYYVVRSSGLYGHTTCHAKGTNFVETMLKLAKERDELKIVCDEILTPTYTLPLAEQIRKLAETHVYGVYHATNNGSCSWYEFAKAIFELANISIKVTPVTAREFAAPVKRPLYSVLENKALQALGIDIMPHWKDSLTQYFEGK